MNAVDNYAPGGLCLAGYNDCDEKVFPPRLNHIALTQDETDMIEFATAKLFYFTSLPLKFRNGGQMQPLLKTWLASILQYLPQMEKDFHGTIRRVGTRKLEKRQACH